MPISNNIDVFNLVRSLDKSEKRHFKLYVNRLSSNKDGNFLKLFIALEKMKVFNEQKLRAVFPTLSKTNFTNLKRHLYTQILKSLRLLHTNRNTEIQIREQIDFAQVLYSKGLYMQSLKILDRISPTAQAASKSLLYFEVLEFRKLIESRHITRSRKIENKVEDLVSESNTLKEIVAGTSAFVNLSLRIHGLYIKLGFAKSNRDLFIIKEYFHSNLPPFDIRKLSFYEYVLLHQSYVWYNYMTLNFKYSFKHAIQWVDHFDENKIMREKDPNLYLRGLHYAMTNAYYLGSLDRFLQYFYNMTSFYNKYSDSFSYNTNILYFNYKTNAEINRLFLERNYKEGILRIPEMSAGLDLYFKHLDTHRIFIFYYKFAWLYFGAGKYTEAINYLNKIINKESSYLRTDIVLYSKLLLLMCHFHLHSYYYISNTILNVKRAFINSDENSKAVEQILELLRKCSKAKSKPSEEELEKIHNKLILYSKDRLEKRPFLYFGFNLWLESIKSNSTMQLGIV